MRACHLTIDVLTCWRPSGVPVNPVLRSGNGERAHGLSIFAMEKNVSVVVRIGRLDELDTPIVNTRKVKRFCHGNLWGQIMTRHGTHLRWRLCSCATKDRSAIEEQVPPERLSLARRQAIARRPAGSVTGPFASL
jgi:hypothetical protein